MCLGVGGGTSGADSPYRFVCYDDIAKLFPGNAGKTAGNLSLEHNEGFIGFALIQGFADAKEDGKSTIQGCPDFSVHAFVGLAEILTPFGVTDDDMGASCIAQHLG